MYNFAVHGVTLQSTADINVTFCGTMLSSAISLPVAARVLLRSAGETFTSPLTSLVIVLLTISLL